MKKRDFSRHWIVRKNIDNSITYLLNNKKMKLGTEDLLSVIRNAALRYELNYKRVTFNNDILVPHIDNKHWINCLDVVYEAHFSFKNKQTV